MAERSVKEKGKAIGLTIPYDIVITVTMLHLFIEDQAKQYNRNYVLTSYFNFVRYKFEREGRTCTLYIKNCRPDDECEYACGVEDRRTRARLFVEGKRRTFYVFQLFY